MFPPVERAHPHDPQAPALRVLIVEDDPLAGELLRTLLGRAGAVKVVGEASTMDDAITALGRNDYDVVFLDVQLVGGSGFDLVPLVKPDAAIIFVTGHDGWAVRAFEVNAADFLVKPVRAARLAEALRRVQAPRAARKVTARFRKEDCIFLRGAAKGGRFVPVDQIVAVISSENYSNVLLADGERWLVRRTMRQWEAMLPKGTFLRVHRTAIVNLHYVERVQRSKEETTELALHGVKTLIPVGRRMWRLLAARLKWAAHR